MISKGTLPKVVQAVIDSLASPESETRINDLILVAHGAAGDLERMVEMKIRTRPSSTNASPCFDTYEQVSRPMSS